jgi:hypothetical protein
MKKATSSIALAASGIVLLLANPASATTCQDLVANNSYDCTIVFEGGGGSFPACFRFVTPGAVSFKFDLHIGTDTLGCTCVPSGSTTRPTFNSSKSFVCLEQSANLAVLFAGKAGAKKARGYAAASNGDSEIYDCTVRSTPCP